MIRERDYSVEGQIELEKTREEGRARIAIRILVFFGVLVGVALIGGLCLVGLDQIEFTELAMLVLLVAGIFSGLAGTVITRYFLR